AKLGGEIGLQRRVIVEMVAAEIGETAGRHAHAIEATLIEPVRGGFDGEMRHAFARELIERAVERDRVRRGERAIDFALRRHEPDRADAGGRMAERPAADQSGRGTRPPGFCPLGRGPAAIPCGWREKTFAAVSAKARRASSTLMNATPSGSGVAGGRSAITAAAPDATACETKLSP